MIKIKSTTSYEVGTILHDDDTGETFSVTKCTRIGLFDTCNWGLELEEVTQGNV